MRNRSPNSDLELLESNNKPAGLQQKSPATLTARRGSQEDWREAFRLSLDKISGTALLFRDSAHLSLKDAATGYTAAARISLVMSFGGGTATNRWAVQVKSQLSDILNYIWVARWGLNNPDHALCLSLMQSITKAVFIILCAG